MSVFVTNAGSSKGIVVAQSIGKCGVKILAGESRKYAPLFYSRYVDGSVVYPVPSIDDNGFVTFLKQMHMGAG